jgi:hypothetical protein
MGNRSPIILLVLLVSGAAVAVAQPATDPPPAPPAPPATVQTVQTAGPEAGPPARRNVVIDATAIERSLDRIGEGLAALQVRAEGGKLPKRQRHALQKEITILRGEVEILRAALRDAPPDRCALIDDVSTDGFDGGAAHGFAPPIAPEPMTQPGFEEVLSSLEQHGFASEKLSVIDDLAAHNWFLAEQARRLIESFSFGKDRLRALERLAPRIVDPQNNFRLYEAFTFESDKSQARRILADQQP